MQPMCKGLYVQCVPYLFEMGSKRVWKTIALPESTLNEVKENMDGFVSVAEFVRAAIRFYIEFRLNPMWKEEVIPEVPPVG